MTSYCLTDYEKWVLVEELASIIDGQTLDRISETMQWELQHTGVGYFLSLTDAHLPTQRQVYPCNTPCRIGTHLVGFVIFIENSEITIECHGWDGSPIPEDIRMQDSRKEI